MSANKSNSLSTLISIFTIALIAWLLWNHAVIHQFPTLTKANYWFVLAIVWVIVVIRTSFSKS